MIKINGKQYPFWSQLVEQKHEWIGGILEDFGDSLDKASGQTKITDVTLRENGDKSAWFGVEGEDFGCGFDVAYGGISRDRQNSWLTFSTYAGHRWRIRKPGSNTETQKS